MLYKSIYDHIDFIYALNTRGKGGNRKKVDASYFFIPENSMASKNDWR